MRPDIAGADLLIEDGRIFLWRRGEPDLDTIDAGLQILAELIDWVPPHLWAGAQANG